MIRTVIENKEKADKQFENSITVYPSEIILGGMVKVKDFAMFHALHKTDLEVVKTSMLIDFCNGLLFTPEQLNAYRMGLDAMGGFFSACELDMQTYITQEEFKNTEAKKGQVG